MIYFITAREIGRVKIGISDNPRRRFASMQTGSPVALKLERACGGSLASEKVLHERFSAYRVIGEWFHLSPEIEAHMDTLAAVEMKPRPERVTRVSAPSKGLRQHYGDEYPTPSKIRHRVHAAGFSMSHLFTRARIHASTFWRWERTGSTPTLLTLEKLRQTLEAIEAERRADAA